MDNVCYDNSFLRGVILRLDFPTPVPALAESLPQNVANAALQRFPIQEPLKTRSHEVMVSNDTVAHRQSEGVEWRFHGENRDKTLTINPTVIGFNRTVYTTYEELKAEFDAVVSPLFVDSSDLRASRMGLRYINQIEIEGDEPLRWSKYISDDLLGIFDTFNDPDILTRLIQVAEFRHNEINLKFQFGMPNPDFPAAIRRRVFVLDFDGSVHGAQDLSELNKNIEDVHTRIQKLFEESITDDLREVMKPSG